MVFFHYLSVNMAKQAAHVSFSHTKPNKQEKVEHVLSQTTGFHHIWMSSQPSRGRAAQQELCSGGFQRFSPVLNSCCPSSECRLSSFSSPHNLEKPNVCVNYQAHNMWRKNYNYLKIAIPSPVSLNELDMGLSFADFGVSFWLSGEEKLTETVKKAEKERKYSSSKV